MSNSISLNVPEGTSRRDIVAFLIETLDSLTITYDEAVEMTGWTKASVRVAVHTARKTGRTNASVHGIRMASADRSHGRVLLDPDAAVDTSMFATDADAEVA